ncbi:MAG: fatty acid-binding protein DegV [Gracilibacter sp. BRH_c7a]|nr:MAG: fatty acid-binding protein DegV [Gracilibacter sp. BRH_c7a]
MTIKIVTDSTCDLPANIIQELGISVIPLKVLFGEEVYRDGIDLTNKEFYEKMAKHKKLPTTSQVNPGEFIEEFTRHIDNGDEVIGIFISAKLSGTYGSAVIAKETMANDSRINIIDSLSASFGLGIQVIEAGRMIQEGKSAQEIVRRIEEIKNGVHFYGVINTLENLKKGGRLSSSGAFAGSLLGIKPIITLRDGAVALIAKARGQKKAFNWVLEDAKKNNIDLNNKTICLAHASAPEGAAEFKKEILKDYQPKEIIELQIGAVIGTHTGGGCVGISCLPD